MSNLRRAQSEVILAAFLFALGVPIGKTLLSGIPPVALSGGIYLSAGITLGISILLVPGGGHERPRGSDWGWLAAVVIAGGVLGPLALFAGLARVPAHVAGMLLNFEALFTLAFGAIFLGERLGRIGWIGALAILGGAVLLSFPATGAAHAPVAPIGTLLVIAACALWGLDNNLTQRIALRDARVIGAVKGLAGGAVLLSLGAALGEVRGFTPARIAGVAASGAIAYGLSLVLFIRGLRGLGVLQTGTLFALAPGFAAVLSLALLGERADAPRVAALVLMTGGALLLARDRHEHFHAHEGVEHVHPHAHDAHHQHAHTPGELAASPHAHPHGHAPLAHSHPHVHDAHHRHRHGG